MKPYTTKEQALAYISVDEIFYDKNNRFSLLSNNHKVYIKGSKYHESSNYYWYRISRKMYINLKSGDIDSIIFIMGHEGLVNIPSSVVVDYIPYLTWTNFKNSNDISHYHFYLKFVHSNVESRVNNRWIDISEYSTVFTDSLKTNNNFLSETKVDNSKIEVRYGYNLVNIIFSPINKDFDYAKLIVRINGRVIEIQQNMSNKFYFALKDLAYGDYLCELNQYNSMGSIIHSDKSIKIKFK